MSTLNPLHLVPANLAEKYLPVVTDAFRAAGAEADLAKLEGEFRQDGGTDRQWNVLKHCASGLSPRA